MPEKAVGIKIRKIQGEKAIVLANSMKIINRSLEVQKDENFIYVPLVRRPSEKELQTFKEQIGYSEILTRTFPTKGKQAKAFAELLEDKLPPHLLASVPKAIDFVGDIAIIEIPPELAPYKEMLGLTILKTHENVRTVLAKAGAISGPYRLRHFSVLAGEPKTETLHREYGCQYHVDLAKVYFSPRLSYEHKRVASLVKQGETIIDLFAGVGPFAIQIAKTREKVKVYAIDVNPDAAEFLKRNTRLNRVEDRVYPMLGDAKHVVEEKLSGVADRVIMNLPEKAAEFIDTACLALKPAGGVVHFYCFVDVSDSLENVKSRFAEAVEECGRELETIAFSRLVRATAPHEWQAVLDAELR